MTTGHVPHDDQSTTAAMPDIPAPEVEFFLFNPDAPAPEPASSTVRGTLPLSGVQKCAPLTDATGFGWYTFPPIDFALRWDGQTVDFSRLVDNEPTQWRSLSGGYDLALDEDQAALARAPERFKADFDVFDHLGGRMAFINLNPQLGNACEITPGLLARTSPGWSLLVRSPPNWPLVRDHRAAHAASGTTVTQGIENFPDDIWARFVENRHRRVDGGGLGTYKAEQRRRGGQ
ncbi:MAG: hypothetical protein ACRDNS_33240 [Trebonia sp.]